MNNIINYYYKMDIVDLYEKNGNFFFKYNGNRYSFVYCDRDKNDINGLIEICEELKIRNLLTNEIVPNIFNSLITNVNGKNYIMIKVNINEYEICFNDIFYIQNNTNYLPANRNLVRANCIDLWKDKIDFYEHEFCKINDKYKLISRTIDYYVGMGENAIEYIVNSGIQINNFVLSHRRINEKMSSFDFYNPLNYIFDNKARDFAEYIKTSFFYKNVGEKTILSFLYYIDFTREEYILFLARMLYPTYYFDLIDKVVLQNENEKNIYNIINKNDEYIELLKKILFYINYELRMNIPPIEWIIKK